MDFAALMSKEISKTSPSSSAPPTESTKTYLRRADIEAQRQEAYAKDQQALRREREVKLQQKRKYDEEEGIRAQEREEKRRRLAEESRIRREAEEKQKEKARRKRLGLPDLPPEKQEGTDDTSVRESEEDIPDEELFTELRALKEPITLFGETHKQRLRRYRKLTAPELLSQIPQSTGPIPTTLVLVPEASMKVPPTVPRDPEGRSFLFRQLASYFTMVLLEWALALSLRPNSVKESFQGKAAYSAMVQSRENMRPLFKKFEKGELEDGILEPVVEIVRASQERRYVDANDGYLRLSIGKA
jgi:pre-mRNA-splicing factor 18